MNILVISDLHLDISDNTGIFKWTEHKFIKTLDDIIIKYNIDQVILNGDIFELYKYSQKDIIEKNINIINYLNSKNVIYIKGNHDIISTYGKLNHTIVNSSGQTIYIEHGHNADLLNGTKIGRFISRMLLQLVKLLSINKFVLNTYQKFIELNDDVNTIPKKYNSYKYLKYALKLLKKHDVKPIEAKGGKFDPHIHEALMQTQTHDHKDGEVLEELQKGYKLNDRVIRTVKVRVAKNISDAPLDGVDDGNHLE